jgi:hypothetical protein
MIQFRLGILGSAGLRLSNNQPEFKVFSAASSYTRRPFPLWSGLGVFGENSPNFRENVRRLLG